MRLSQLVYFYDSWYHFCSIHSKSTNFSTICSKSIFVAIEPNEDNSTCRKKKDRPQAERAIILNRESTECRNGIMQKSRKAFQTDSLNNRKETFEEAQFIIL